MNIMSEAQEKRLVLLATLAIGLIAVLPHVITPVLTPKDTPYVPMFRKAITAINEDEVTLAPFMNHAFRVNGCLI
jgi:hypothetical protein